MQYSVNSSDYVTGGVSGAESPEKERMASMDYRLLITLGEAKSLPDLILKMLTLLTSVVIRSGDQLTERVTGILRSNNWVRTGLTPSWSAPTRQSKKTENLCIFIGRSG